MGHLLARQACKGSCPVSTAFQDCLTLRTNEQDTGSQANSLKHAYFQRLFFYPTIFFLQIVMRTKTWCLFSSPIPAIAFSLRGKWQHQQKGDGVTSLFQGAFEASENGTARSHLCGGNTKTTFFLTLERKYHLC